MGFALITGSCAVSCGSRSVPGLIVASVEVCLCRFHLHGNDCAELLPFVICRRRKAQVFGGSPDTQRIQKWE